MNHPYFICVFLKFHAVHFYYGFKASLEATSLLKKGRLNAKGLEEIRRMDDKRIRTFADSPWEQVQDHSKRAGKEGYCRLAFIISFLFSLLKS